MSTNHVPGKHADWLRQTLAHDKKPLGVLLGAGCPAAIDVGGTPLIPDIGGLTRAVVEGVKGSALEDPFKRLTDHFQTDCGRPPNIEDALSFIRSLRSVAGKGSVRDLSASELDQLDSKTCTIVAENVDQMLPDSKTPYHQLAAWSGAIRRSVAVELFTTNYDLLMEQALEAHRVPYFDGFVGSHRSFFDTHAIDSDGLPARWARLWKMHGSINWSRDANGNVIRRPPTDKEGCVIHPSHLKYDESRRMPYIALMDRLRGFLRQPNAFLLTCGFSFRDQHINEVILESLQGNPTATVFALFRGDLDRYREAQGVGLRRANLGVLAVDGAIIGTRRAPWMEQLGELPGSSLAVEWVEKPDPAAAGGAGAATTKTWKARFRLGDFNRLGEFLEDLIGSETSKSYGPAAE